MPTCLVVQHVLPESTWSIGAALEKDGVTLDVRRTFLGDEVPSTSGGYDGLVVLGGPMSATSDEGFPTRRTEVALLADAVALGVPTLGICLGAQLLASAAGASVHPGTNGPEIGWAPVELTAGRDEDSLLHGLPASLGVLHWHSDTFDLPAHAHHLARTDRYQQQAFRVGRAAWGLQFHIEVTAEAVQGFLAAFTVDAARAPGGAASIGRQTPGRLAALAPSSKLVFERFAALVAHGADPEWAPSSPHGFARVSDS
jgi:GMP synthase-like glutamine amidotransferase